MPRTDPRSEAWPRVRSSAFALLRALAVVSPPLLLAGVLLAAPKAPAPPAGAKPPKPIVQNPPPKKPPPPPAKADAGGDAADAKAPKEAVAGKSDATPAPASTGGELVKETEKKEGDASVKVFEFGMTEVEGRSRWPAITYFTRRMRAEFEAQKLPHRPFLPELGATKGDPAVK